MIQVEQLTKEFTLNKKQQKEALERLKAGESVSKIAKAFSVSRVTVSRLRDREG